MNSIVKKLTATLSALAAATALVACSSDPTMSAFQNPRPWQTSEGDVAYEKLDYTVALYDAKKGTSEEKRVKIADGTLSYTLDYGTQTALGGEASLEMNMSVTYNDSAPSKDKGLTDTMTSLTRFRTESLEAIGMDKSVTLAVREGEKKNNSYKIAADYAKGKATLEMNGNTKTLKGFAEKCWDNELMYYLARATNIKKSSSTLFHMSNLFDCFQKGEYEELTMVAVAKSKLTQLEFDPWIKDYVITKEQEAAEKEEEKNKVTAATAQEGDGAGDGEEQEEPYKLPCFCVEIAMNVDESGPSQFVYYSERPIEDGGLRHKKVPVKMSYTLYNGSKAEVVYEYTLSSLSFVRP
ncbi:MAG: hypothetical protein J1G38_07600 [Clostridiales bacterium]|nr:hypothetical protein [Clostridiales bacterium]